MRASSHHRRRRHSRRRPSAVNSPNEEAGYVDRRAAVSRTACANADACECVGASAAQAQCLGVLACNADQERLGIDDSSAHCIHVGVNSLERIQQARQEAATRGGHDTIAGDGRTREPTKASASHQGEAIDIEGLVTVGLEYIATIVLYCLMMARWYLGHDWVSRLRVVVLGLFAVSRIRLLSFTHSQQLSLSLSRCLSLAE